MRGQFALVAGIGFCAAVLATPAAACVYLPVECYGPVEECHPTPEEAVARLRRQSIEETRRLAIEARERVRSGNVDFAAELSELLVPNVRPVGAIETSCGLQGEIDYGEGRETFRSLFEKFVAGTPLTGSDPYGLSWLYRDADLVFGERCNAEFRRSFAAYLQDALRPADLRQAWQFLSARKRTQASYGSVYPRLMRFEGNSRTPPVRWSLADFWLNDQARRYVRRQPAGRALAEALDSFWAERGNGLDEDRRACPEFSARWEAQRSRLLAQLTAGPERRGQAPLPGTQP